MIRPIVPDDTPAVVALAVAAELFPPDDAEIVEALLADYFSRGRDHGHVCVLELGDTDAAPVGVAYWEPAPATDRVWYLIMIGVARPQHRRGIGTVLLHHVEQELRHRGQRLLLVETSGTAAFARARAFYRARGYDEEARVRDYYEPGDDMILFRKELTAP